MTNFQFNNQLNKQSNKKLIISLVVSFMLFALAFAMLVGGINLPFSSNNSGLDNRIENVKADDEIPWTCTFYTSTGISTLYVNSDSTTATTARSSGYRLSDHYYIDGYDYITGDTMITCRVALQSGYHFLGWFTGSYGSGNLISTDLSYTFYASETSGDFYAYASTNMPLPTDWKAQLYNKGVSLSSITKLQFTSAYSSGYSYVGDLSTGIKIYQSGTIVQLVSNDGSARDIMAPVDSSYLFNASSYTQLLSSLETIDFVSFNTSLTTNMRYMFYSCSSLKTLNFYTSKFVTTKVTNMNYMFGSCENLESLDLTDWDMSKVTSASNMFDGCSNIVTIDSPINIKINIPLPDTGKTWYMSDAYYQTATSFVTNISYSHTYTTNITKYHSDLNIYNPSGVQDGASGTCDITYTKDGVTYASGAGIADETWDCNADIFPERTYIKVTNIVPKEGYRVSRVVIGGEERNKNGSGSNAYYSYTMTGNANVEIFMEADTYTVTFNGNGATPSFSTKTVTYGSTYGDLPTISRTGYTFKNWATSSGTAVTSSTKVTTQSNHTLYANWTINIETLPNDWLWKACDYAGAKGYYSSFKSKITSITFTKTQPNTSTYKLFAYIGDSYSIEVYAYPNTMNLQQVVIYLPNTIYAPVDSSKLFADFTALTTIDFTNLNTSYVTNMYAMFQNCSAITMISSTETINVSSFDTSNVTNMSYMFSGCTSLGYIDIDEWDISSVEDVSYMFNECTSLGDAYFPTSSDYYNIKNMSHMFCNCSEFDYETLYVWNTVACENMDYMFYNCSAWTTMFISLDMNNVTSAINMFAGCTSLSRLIVPLYIDISIDVPEGKTWYDWAEGYVVVETLPLNLSPTTQRMIIAQDMPDRTFPSDWKDQINSSSYIKQNSISPIDPTNIASIVFTHSIPSNFTSTNLAGRLDNTTIGIFIYIKSSSTSGKYDVAFVYGGNIVAPIATSLFSQLTSITSIDFQNFDTSSTTTLTLWFNNDTNLKTVNLNNLDTTSVQGAARMFYNCSSLVSLDLSNLDFSSMISGIESTRYGYGYMFQGCSSLQDVKFGDKFCTDRGSITTTMFAMFQGCSSLTSLDLSMFNTVNITRMNNMFYNCSNLKEINFGSNFNASNVQYVTSMFQGCSSLTSVDLSTFSTSNVTGLASLFIDCSSLTNIEFGDNFNVSKVTLTTSMFQGCSSLTSLDLSKLTFSSSLTTVTNMFTGCTALNLIFSPLSVPTSISMLLPSGSTWYDYYDYTIVTYLPKGQTVSHVLKTTAPEFDVTINKNTGSDSDKSTLTYSLSKSEQTLTITNPTRTGYTFNGWTVAWSDSTHSATLPTILDTTLTIPAKCYGNVTLTANWTVIPVSISANPTKLNLVYGYTSGNTSTITASDGSGSYSYSITSKTGTWTLSATSGVSITLTFATGQNVGSNYTATVTVTDTVNGTTASVTVTAVVTKADSSIATKPTAKSLTYNGTAQALVNAGSASGGTIQYKVGTGSYSTNIPTGIDAGSYTVYYKVVGDANHNDSEDASLNVEINKRSLTLTWSNTSFNYDGSSHIPTATVSGAVSGETVNITIVESKIDAGSYTATASISSVTGGQAKASNYTISNSTQSWTINPRIIFNGNGNTSGSMSNQYVPYNTSTALTANAFAKTGYTFSGWATSASGAVAYKDKASVTLTASSTTLYAKWTANTDTAYKVQHWQEKLNVDGSVQNSTNYTLKETENLTGTTGASVTPSVKSYTGFTSPSTQTVTISADGSTVVNYYYTRNSYTLTLTAGTGTNLNASPNGSVEYGATVTITASLKAGYQNLVTSAYKTGDTKTIVTISNNTFTMPAYATTVATSSGIITYTITYNLDGGTVATANPTSYTVETASFTLNNPTKTGYTFAGWTGTGLSSATTTVTIAKGSTGNRTYTATWTVNSFTLTVVYQGFNGANATNLVAVNATNGEVGRTKNTSDNYYTVDTTNAIEKGKSRTITLNYTTTKQTIEFYTTYITRQYRISTSTTSTDAFINNTHYTPTALQSNNKDYSIVTYDWTPTANVTIYVFVQEYFTIDHNARLNGGTNNEMYNVFSTVSLTVTYPNGTTFSMGNVWQAFPYNTIFTTSYTAKDGYMFSYVSGGTLTTNPSDYVTSHTFAEDKALTSDFSVNASGSTLYKVIFDNNGGSGTMATQTAIYMANETVSANTFTRTGYTFSGWALTSTGAVVVTDSGTINKTILSSLTGKANEEITLYAVWTANELTFNDQTLKTGTYGANYSDSFTGASNGTGSYKYEITGVTCDGTTVTASSGKYNGLSLSNTTISGTPTKAGTYKITVKVTDNGSGKTKTAVMTIVINKANASISLDKTSATVQYGNSTTFTIKYVGDGSLNVTSGSATYVSVSRNGNVVTATVIAYKASTTVTVTVSATAGTNYNAPANAAFTVTLAQRDITITSSSDSKVYDGSALTKHEATITSGSLVSGDSIAYTFTGTQTNVGSSDNTFTAKVTKNSTDITSYYNISYVYGKLTVTIAKLSTPSGLTWDKGTAKWNSVSAIGSVTVTYKVTLYKGSTAVTNGSTTIKDTSYDFSSLIRSSGTGTYTFTVQAISSVTANVSNSDNATSGNQYAVKVTMKTGTGIATATINSASSYVIINGETGVTITATESAGYTFSNFTSSSTKITIKDASSKSTTISYSSTAVDSDITITANATINNYTLTINYKDANVVTGTALTVTQADSTVSGSLSKVGDTVTVSHNYSTTDLTVTIGAVTTGHRYVITTGSLSTGSKTEITNNMTYTWTPNENGNVTIDVYVTEYFFIDLNSVKNNSTEVSGNLNSYGTANVTINNTQISTNVTDYFEFLPTGTTYKFVVKPNTNYVISKDKVKANFVSTSITYENTTGIKANISLAPYINSTYTIAFNGNGSTSGSTSSMTGVIYGFDYTLNANGFVKNGYAFSGWATSASGAKVYDDKATVKSLSSTAGATVTLYAVWTINSYTLTINPNGGSYDGTTENTTVSQNYGTTYNVGTPTRDGYSFAGWTLTGSGSLGLGAKDNEFTKTVKNEDNKVYTNFKFTRTGNGNKYWASQRFSSYTFTAGKTYVLTMQIRVNEITGARFYIRHARRGNDYYAGAATYLITKATNGWITVSIERQFDETFVTNTETGATSKTSPIVEIYTENLNGNGTSYLFDFDIADIKVVEKDTNKQVYSSNVYTFGAGNGTLTANWVENVAKVEIPALTTYFSTLEDAMVYVNSLTSKRSNRTVVTLLKDYTATSSMAIDSGKYITLKADTAVTLTRGFTGNLFVNRGNFQIGASTSDTNLTINGNNKPKSVINNSGTLTINNGTFLGDGTKQATAYTDVYGGFVDSPGTLTINNGTFKWFIAQLGGVIKPNHGSTTNIHGGTFTENKSMGYAGVIDAYGITNITGGSFTYNTAFCGGVTSQTDNSTSQFYISGGTFENNSASYTAGAIYMHNGTISGNAIIRNNKAVDAGGVYLGSNTVTISGGTITGNTATSNGGGVYVKKNTHSITGGTISDNTAVNGAGIFLETGTLAISGGTISGNTASSTGGGIYSAGTLNVTGGTLGQILVANSSNLNINGNATINEIKLYYSKNWGNANLNIASDFTLGNKIYFTGETATEISRVTKITVTKAITGNYKVDLSSSVDTLLTNTSNVFVTYASGVTPNANNFTITDPVGRSVETGTTRNSTLGVTDYDTQSLYVVGSLSAVVGVDGYYYQKNETYDSTKDYTSVVQTTKVGKPTITANGTTGTTLSVAYGTSVTYTAPAVTGYTFRGWYNSNTTFNSSTFVSSENGYTIHLTEKTTLYALYSINYYYVDLNIYLDDKSLNDVTAVAKGLTAILNLGGTDTGNIGDYYAQKPYGTNVYLKSFNISNTAQYQFEKYYIKNVLHTNASEVGSEYSQTVGTGTLNVYIYFTTKTYYTDINIISPANKQDYDSGRMDVAYYDQNGTLKYNFENIENEISSGHPALDTVSNTTMNSLIYMPYGSTIVISNIKPYAGYSLKNVTFSGSADSLVDNKDGTYTITVKDSGGIHINMKSNTYNITYNYDGGSVTTANTATYDCYPEDKTISLTAPTRTGYTFAGWTVTWTDSTHSGTLPTISSNTMTIPSKAYGNITVKATWTENTYNLTFKAVYNSFEVKIAKADGTVYRTLTATADTNHEYTITGIYFTDIIVTGTTGINKTVSGTSITAIKASNNPTRDGYAWGTKNYYYMMQMDSCGLRWYDAWNSGYTNGNTACTSFSRMQSTNGGSASLTLLWTAKTYTVTANANGGTISETTGWTLASDSKTATKSVTYDSTYGTLPSATRTGYTFAGWFTDATNGTQVTETSKFTTAGNVTLYAHWTTNSYTVTVHYYHQSYDENNNLIIEYKDRSFEVLYGATVEIPESDIGSPLIWGKKPYRTIGFTRNALTTPTQTDIKTNSGFIAGTSFSFVVGAENVDYYQAFEFSLSFAAYCTPNLPDNAERKGAQVYYTTVNDSLTTELKVVTGASQTVTANYYQDKPLTYTDADGYTWTLVGWNPNYGAITGDFVTEVTISDTSYSWTSNYNSSNPWSFVKNLRSIWQRDVSYTVSYDENGHGTKPSDTVVTLKQNANHSLTTKQVLEFNITLADALTASGYKFNGWNDKQDGTGTTYEAGKVATFSNVTEPTTITLYAMWEVSAFNITGNIYFNNTILEDSGLTIGVSGDGLSSGAKLTSKAQALQYTKTYNLTIKQNESLEVTKVSYIYTDATSGQQVTEELEITLSNDTVTASFVVKGAGEIRVDIKEKEYTVTVKFDYSLVPSSSLLSDVLGASISSKANGTISNDSVIYKFTYGQDTSLIIMPATGFNIQSVVTDDSTITANTFTIDLIVTKNTTITVKLSTDSWLDNVTTTSLNGQGTASNPYIIKNTQDLAFVAKQVFLGESGFDTAHYKVVDDANIDLTGHSWYPIGTSYVKKSSGDTVTREFNGTFIGDYSTISNMTIPAGNNIGLFGIIGTDGTVQSVIVDNASVTGGYRIGGIVGHNKGTVINSGVTNSQVIGYNQEIESTDFKNAVGGITGVNDGTLKQVYTENTNISGYASSMGGLVGYNSSTVLNAYNRNGTVRNNLSNSSEKDPNAGTGGIIGRNAGSLTNAYIASDSNDTIISTSVTEGVGTGAVSQYTGAVVGNTMTGHSETNTYYTSNAKGTQFNNIGTVETYDNMKTTSFLALLNDSEVWVIDANLNDGLPTFTKVYSFKGSLVIENSGTTYIIVTIKGENLSVSKIIASGSKLTLTDVRAGEYTISIKTKAGNKFTASVTGQNKANESKSQESYRSITLGNESNQFVNAIVKVVTSKNGSTGFYA